MTFLSLVMNNCMLFCILEGQEWFSMVETYKRLYNLYPGSDFVWHFQNTLIIDFLENVLARHHSHLLLILWPFFVSSTKWSNYFCIKKSWLISIFTWTNKKKAHNTNKANRVMLIYPKHDLTILVLHYLLLIIHGTYAPVKPCTSHHHNLYFMLIGDFTLWLFLMRLVNDG